MSEPPSRPLLVSARDAAGRVPKPVRIGRSLLWRVDELAAWVAAGAPPRAKWDWTPTGLPISDD